MCLSVCVCVCVCLHEYPLVHPYLELKMICSSSKKSLRNKTYYFLLGAELPI